LPWSDPGDFNRVVQDFYTKPFARLIQPVDVSLAGAGKFQQKLLFVTSMRDMPNVARHKITISSWHNIPLQSDKSTPI
jgi:hypothetical protein